MEQSLQTIFNQNGKLKNFQGIKDLILLRQSSGCLPSARVMQVPVRLIYSRQFYLPPCVTQFTVH
jgi:hypothetical protein